MSTEKSQSELAGTRHLGTVSTPSCKPWKNFVPTRPTILPSHIAQRDVMNRTMIDKWRTTYEPNSIDGGWLKGTFPAAQDCGFESYHECIDA